MTIIETIKDQFLRRPTRALIAVAFLGQTAVIGTIVADRAALLRSATEIELDVAPVDPRSLFRGDYVTLSYPAARVPASAIVDMADLEVSRTVFVTLAKNEAGEWRPVKAGAARPAAGPGEVVVRAFTMGTGWRTQKEVTVRYGIEAYFVPEGSGREIESAARQQQVRVKVAVGSDGRAAIKGLIVDGRVIDEPMI